MHAGSLEQNPSMYKMSCPSPSTKLVTGNTCMSSCQYDFEVGTYCGPDGKVQPCPPGSYCPISPYRPFQPMKATCPDGKYCPGGTRNPISCTTDGTYCPAGSIAPTDCEPGYFCNNLHEYHNQCPYGRYCPAKTGPYSLQCPAGYNCKNSSWDLSKDVCPAGYFCPPGTGEVGQNFDPTECGKGYYCPLGSANETLCPAGTFSEGEKYTGHKTVSCSDCPPGKYCPNRGHYKYNDPEMGPTTNMPDCPAGKYCPGKTITPIACAAKQWCPDGSAAQTACSKCPSVSYSWSNPNCTSSGVGSCSKATATTTCCDVSDSTYNAPKCPTGWVAKSSCTKASLFKVQRCIRAPCK